MNKTERFALILALALSIVAGAVALALIAWPILAPASPGIEAVGDTNFTNVVASGDLTAGDDVTAGDDLVATDDLTVTDDAAIGGDLTVTGTTTLANLYASVDYTAVTTDTTITAAQSGMLFANQGAAGAVVMDLPAAAEGLNYCFYVYAAQNFDLNAATGDQIHVLTNATGDAIRNATAGGFICLVAIDGTYWVKVASGGTWSDVN